MVVVGKPWNHAKDQVPYTELRWFYLQTFTPIHTLGHFYLFSVPFSQTLLHPRWLMAFLKFHAIDNFKLFFDLRATFDSTDHYFLEIFLSFKLPWFHIPLLLCDVYGHLIGHLSQASFLWAVLKCLCPTKFHLKLSSYMLLIICVDHLIYPMTLIATYTPMFPKCLSSAWIFFLSRKALQTMYPSGTE